jgi:hypothetical protein
MGRTLDPETLVANQAKMTPGNNPKAKTKYRNPSRSLKSHVHQQLPTKQTETAVGR